MGRIARSHYEGIIESVKGPAIVYGNPTLHQNVAGIAKPPADVDLNRVFPCVSRPNPARLGRSNKLRQLFVWQLAKRGQFGGEQLVCVGREESRVTIVHGGELTQTLPAK